MNTDKEPHRCVMCSDRFSRAQSRTHTTHETVYVPRDKFTPATTHPVNQILANFRITAGTDRDALATFTALELHALTGHDRDSHPVEHRTHATLVLNRLRTFLDGA